MEALLSASGPQGSNLLHSRSLQVSPTKRIPPIGQMPAARIRGDASNTLPEAAAAAPTRIPPADHVKTTGPLPATSPNRWKSERDFSKQLWHTTIFPAELPLGRDQVYHLKQWLSDSVTAFDAREAEAFRALEEAERSAALQLLGSSAHNPTTQALQAPKDEKNHERRAKRAMALLDVYGTAVREIVRQEKTVNADRSALLSEIWTAVSSMVGEVLGSVSGILLHVQSSASDNAPAVCARATVAAHAANPLLRAPFIGCQLVRLLANSGNSMPAPEPQLPPDPFTRRWAGLNTGTTPYRSRCPCASGCGKPAPHGCGPS